MIAQLLVVICLHDPRPQARKRRKNFCEVGPKEGAIEQFFDLGLAAAAVKNKDFHKACTFFPSF